MVDEQPWNWLHFLRGYAAANVIFHVFDKGIYDELARKALTAAELARTLKLDANILSHVLEYCRIEGLMERDGEAYRLSQMGTALGFYRGWFIFFVGGYGKTFEAIGDCLETGNTTPPRDFANISVGSCEISRHGAFPLMQQLMSLLPKSPQFLLDLGCGNGLYLTSLCANHPQLRAIGVEAHSASYAAAVSLVKSTGMAERVRILQADAITAIRNYQDKAPDLIAFAFVLHEILGQDGPDGLLKLLRDVAVHFANSYVIVVETDYVTTDDRLQSLPVFKGYYNPYYLTQGLTGQKLRPKAAWRQLFREAGFGILAEKSVNSQFDPTELEIGFLLRPTEANPVI